MRGLSSVEIPSPSSRSKIPPKSNRMMLVLMLWSPLASTMKKAGARLEGRVKRVIISALFADVPMFVMGMSHMKYNNLKIVSNASWTTNCLTPGQVIHDNSGILERFRITVHTIIWARIWPKS
ncbi:Glyceraldehyde-3-phosphate dehydrogenase [Plecturocebus cupreus]